MPKVFLHDMSVDSILLNDACLFCITQSLIPSKRDFSLEKRFSLFLFMNDFNVALVIFFVFSILITRLVICSMCSLYQDDLICQYVFNIYLYVVMFLLCD